MTTRSKSSWRDVLAIHPAAELLPRPSQDELVTLGLDIRANGLHFQIAIFNATAEAEGREYSKKDDQFNMLDGISRLDAMEAVNNIEFNLVLIANRDHVSWLLKTDDVFLPDGYGFLPAKIVYSDPYRFVLSANLHRRHLTAEAKRELVAKLIKATPEKSDRQIAEQVQASPTTVGKVRKELEQTGDVSNLDTRTDSRGRQQQAHKPPAKDHPAVVAADEQAKIKQDTAVERVADAAWLKSTSELASDDLIDAIETKVHTLEQIEADQRRGLTDQEWALAEKTKPIAARQFLIETIILRNELIEENVRLRAREIELTDAVTEARAKAETIDERDVRRRHDRGRRPPCAPPPDRRAPRPVVK